MVRIAFFLMLTIIVTAANGATSRTGLRTSTTSRAAQETATPNAAYNYNYMYPYLNNQMRTELNPGVTPSQSSNPIDVITRTEQLGTQRRVVARSAARNTNTARSASAQPAANTARAAQITNPAPSASQSTTAARAATRTNTSARRVVARSARGDSQYISQAAGRGDNSYISQTAANAANSTYSTGESLSSSRCLADYTECMNGYCARENTAYNRCYCSAKLAQIDAQYQPAIDQLIKQIITLQSTNVWSADEMNEYWMEMVGKYSGTNSWTNLDNALNINWADTESRVRGQQAFATGHDYCVQHLRGCYYMAANLRDAYRSEIARDCDTYETGLMKIKNVAEAIVESYND